MSIYKGPKQSPGFLLWRVSTSWRGRIEAVLKTYGLTHPQFVILAATGWLTKDGKLTTQALIGKLVGLDPNTTSQVIKGLEQKELIKREKSTDGRAKNVSLTSQGATVLSGAMPAVEKADAEFFSVFTKAEAKNLLKMFCKLSPE